MRVEKEVLLDHRRPGGSPMKTPHRDYDKLRAEIAARFPKLSPRLQQIARFALEHPNEFALQNVTMIASRLGVAPSAIIRFAKALDFRGFSDMQAVFRLPLCNDSASYQYESPPPLNGSSGEVVQHPTVAVLEDLLDTSVASIKLLLRELPPDRLECALQSLCTKLRTVAELDAQVAAAHCPSR